MCGIVGLFLKRPGLEPHLGALLAAMLTTMRERGPDSAGFAIYTGSENSADTIKLSLHAPSGTNFETLAADLGGTLETRGTQAILHVPASRLAQARAALVRRAPGTSIVGEGRSMELYKAVGLPADVSARFGLPTMAGTHAIGHTRMATESAVTTDGAHPYTTGVDQCLVHNGSLSNHNALRRMLLREGFAFQTDNDTEVAAAYLTWRMRQGDSLPDALRAGLRDLDGFYTFVIGTRTGFAVLRDPIGCKPAIMAETDDWVGFGSEFRALAGLPGIAQARVWEPEPAQIYAWDRAA